MAGAAPSRGCDDVRKNRFLTRSAVCGALKAYRKKYLPALYFAATSGVCLIPSQAPLVVSKE
jgi:hypothetical protein